jgi:hypothetical protein
MLDGSRSLHPASWPWLRRRAYKTDRLCDVTVEGATTAGVVVTRLDPPS